MKKHLFKFVSILLIFVLTVLSLSSCGLYLSTNAFKYPKGYTGGFGSRDPASTAEFAWVETYEEVLAAVELLSSHGSRFFKNTFFSYDGDLFDTKYCFVFLFEKDYVKFGENPFDRYAGEIYIQSFAFFEEVTIEELIYSSTSRYDVLYFYPYDNFQKYYQTNDILTKLPKKHLTYRGNLTSGRVVIEYDNVYSDDEPCEIVQMYREKWDSELKKRVNYEISEETLDAILDSIIIFGEYYK